MQRQTTQSVDLADIFGSVVSQLSNDRSQINAVDGSNGNHGDNVLHNFQLVQSVLNGARGQNASTQLQQAASVLRNNGKGATANLYAQGLQQAAQNLQGRSAISANDVLPLLQGLLGGVQQQTTAQQGQGSLLDTLLPAVTSYASARSSGQSNAGAITSALGAALRGSQQTYAQPSIFGRPQQPYTQPQQNAGALSAGSLLQGVFNALGNL